MTEDKKVKPNYFGSIMLIAIMLGCFIFYDDMSSFESMESSTSKRKLFSILFYTINRTTVGYVLGRGLFLAVALYGLKDLYIKFKNRSK